LFVFFYLLKIFGKIENLFFNFVQFFKDFARIFNYFALILGIHRQRIRLF